MNDTWSHFVNILNSEHRNLPKIFYTNSNFHKVTSVSYSNVEMAPATFERNVRKININVFKCSCDLILEAGLFRGVSKNTFSFGGEKILKDKIFNRGRYLYCGWILPHYGHFIMESISRLWYLQDDNAFDGFVFQSIGDGAKHFKEKAYINDILTCFGITKDRVKIINSASIFEKVIFPDQSLFLHRSVDLKAQETIWDTLRLEMIPKNSSLVTSILGNKVYVSRSKLNGKRRLVNELDLETALVKEGFEIIHPQLHSLEEQTKMLSMAELIVAPSGSALHNVFMFNKKCKVVSLVSEKFCLINELLGLLPSNIQYYLFFGETLDNKDSWSVNIGKLIHSLKKI